MKKIISLLLLGAMLLSLCACGADKGEAEQSAEAEVQETAAVEPESLREDELEAIYASGDYAKVLELEEIEQPGELEQLMRALCLYYGYGCEAEPDAAIGLIQPLAEGGEAFALYMMGKASFSGEGAAQNPELAKEYFAKAIEAALARSTPGLWMGSVSFALADCHINALGTERDKEQGFAYAREAAESGSLSVFEKFTLADMLSGLAKDARDNVENELGEMGLGLQDMEAKLDELKMQMDESKPEFAQLGEETKAAKLAEIEKYEGILASLAAADKQSDIADKLCREAKSGIFALAEEGNLSALKFAGDYYFGALGGEAQDYEKAMDMYMQAADFDYAPAQAQIALMYQEGYGVEVSYEQAMEWNNRAAQQGNAQGQAQIGYLYHMGLGVTQNLDEAGRWYSRAADQGDTWAAAKLAQTEITNPQLAFEFHA